MILYTFQDPNRGPGRGDLQTVNNHIEIPNLHPYSFYNFEVKANVRPRIPNKIPESKETIAETLQGVPDVKPNDGPINTKIRETELTFYWRPPNLSSCENFNGELDGYHVILKGIDPWNKGRFIKIKNCINYFLINKRYLVINRIIRVN